MLLPVKNIIFDFGGVLYDIDFGRCAEALRAFGVSDFEQYLTKEKQHLVFDLIDIGKISPEDFRSQICELISMNLSAETVDAAWNALLIGYKDKSMQVLPKIKTHYKIFLLSNSNQIHYNHFLPSLTRDYCYKSFDDLFNKAYFSHEMHLRKPDPLIFETLLKEQQLVAAETLFIDDLLVNVEAARNVGLQGYHLDLDKGESVEGMFDEDGRLRVTSNKRQDKR